MAKQSNTEINPHVFKPGEAFIKTSFISRLKKKGLTQEEAERVFEHSLKKEFIIVLKYWDKIEIYTNNLPGTVTIKKSEK